LHAKRLGDGAQDEIRVPQRREVDEPHAVRESRAQAARDLQRQPSLPHAGGAGQGEQPDRGGPQQPLRRSRPVPAGGQPGRGGGASGGGGGGGRGGGGGGGGGAAGASAAVAADRGARERVIAASSAARSGLPSPSAAASAPTVAR